MPGNKIPRGVAENDHKLVQLGDQEIEPEPLAAGQIAASVSDHLINRIRQIGQELK
jgi:hypothetical protein